jgi:hypothetical protein
MDRTSSGRRADPTNVLATPIAGFRGLQGVHHDQESIASPEVSVVPVPS